MTTGTLALKTVSLRLCQKIGSLRLVGFHPMNVIPANRMFFNGFRSGYGPSMITFYQWISPCPAINCKVQPGSCKDCRPSCHQEWDPGTSTCDNHYLRFGKSLFVLGIVAGNPWVTQPGPHPHLYIPNPRGSWVYPSNRAQKQPRQLRID